MDAHEAREACGENFREWRREFFPDTFYAADTSHRERLLQALAGVAELPVSGSCPMPRGDGTTSTLEAFALWAALERKALSVTLFTQSPRALRGVCDEIANRAKTSEKLVEAYGIETERGLVDPVLLHRRRSDRLEATYFDGTVIPLRVRPARDAPAGRGLDLQGEQRGNVEAGPHRCHLVVVDTQMTLCVRAVSRMSIDPTVRVIGAGVSPESVACRAVKPVSTRANGTDAA